jgi:PPOX class probable F420-dependent enzyme
MVDVPDSHRDLVNASVATLATIDPQGRPQLTEVWFLFDEGEFRLSLHTARRKVENLQRNPACNLFVLDLNNPLRYLEVRGDAEMTPDKDYAFASKVGAKYGADLRVMDGPDGSRVVVMIRPATVNAVDIGG